MCCYHQNLSVDLVGGLFHLEVVVLTTDEAFAREREVGEALTRSSRGG